MNTISSIVYTVNDLNAATLVHTAILGTGPHTQQPYYVGFRVGEVDIALVPHDPSGGAVVPVAFVHVVDLEAAVAEAQAAGATVAEEPHDVGGGTRLAKLHDGAGNIVGLITRT